MTAKMIQDSSGKVLEGEQNVSRLPFSERYIVKTKIENSVNKSPEKSPWRSSQRC